MLRPAPDSESPDFLRGQYGYRESKSIVDEIRQTLMGSIVEEERAIAISLDIMNAFNILSWDRMIATLKYHEVPAYLILVLTIQDYFRGRTLEYRNIDGFQCSKAVFRKIRKTPFQPSKNNLIGY